MQNILANPGHFEWVKPNKSGIYEGLYLIAWGLCVRVCVCVCTYICTYIHIYIYTYINKEIQLQEHNTWLKTNVIVLLEHNTF